jgi:dephospho-CoA kinase
MLSGDPARIGGIDSWRTEVAHPLTSSGKRNARADMSALLFRDYLRADDAARRAWGAFKQRLALSVPDLLDYGQIKAPATQVLMRAAERWAAETGWSAAQAT